MEDPDKTPVDWWTYQFNCTYGEDEVIETDANKISALKRSSSNQDDQEVKRPKTKAEQKGYPSVVGSTQKKNLRRKNTTPVKNTSSLYKRSFAAPQIGTGDLADATDALLRLREFDREQNSSPINLCVKGSEKDSHCEHPVLANASWSINFKNSKNGTRPASPKVVVQSIRRDKDTIDLDHQANGSTRGESYYVARLRRENCVLDLNGLSAQSSQAKYSEIRCDFNGASLDEVTERLIGSLVDDEAQNALCRAPTLEVIENLGTVFTGDHSTLSPTNVVSVEPTLEVPRDHRGVEEVDSGVIIIAESSEDPSESINEIDLIDDGVVSNLSSIIDLSTSSENVTGEDLTAPQSPASLCQHRESTDQEYRPPLNTEELPSEIFIQQPAAQILPSDSEPIPPRESCQRFDPTDQEYHSPLETEQLPSETFQQESSKVENTPILFPGADLEVQGGSTELTVDESTTASGLLPENVIPSTANTALDSSSSCVQTRTDSLSLQRDDQNDIPSKQSESLNDETERENCVSSSVQDSPGSTLSQCDEREENSQQTKIDSLVVDFGTKTGASPCVQDSPDSASSQHQERVDDPQTPIESLDVEFGAKNDASPCVQDSPDSASCQRDERLDQPQIPSEPSDIAVDRQNRASPCVQDSPDSVLPELDGLQTPSESPVVEVVQENGTKMGSSCVQDSPDSVSPEHHEREDSPQTPSESPVVEVVQENGTKIGSSWVQDSPDSVSREHHEREESPQTPSESPVVEVVQENGTKMGSSCVQDSPDSVLPEIDGPQTLSEFPAVEKVREKSGSPCVQDSPDSVLPERHERLDGLQTPSESPVVEVVREKSGSPCVQDSPDSASPERLDVPHTPSESLDVLDEQENIASPCVQDSPDSTSLQRDEYIPKTTSDSLDVETGRKNITSSFVNQNSTHSHSYQLDRADTPHPRPELSLSRSPDNSDPAAASTHLIPSETKPFTIHQTASNEADVTASMSTPQKNLSSPPRGKTADDFPEQRNDMPETANSRESPNPKDVRKSPTESRSKQYDRTAREPETSSINHEMGGKRDTQGVRLTLIGKSVRSNGGLGRENLTKIQVPKSPTPPDVVSSNPTNSSTTDYTVYDFQDDSSAPKSFETWQVRRTSNPRTYPRSSKKKPWDASSTTGSTSSLFQFGLSDDGCETDSVVQETIVTRSRTACKQVGSEEDFNSSSTVQSNAVLSSTFFTVVKNVAERKGRGRPEGSKNKVKKRSSSQNGFKTRHKSDSLLMNKRLKVNIDGSKTCDENHSFLFNKQLKVNLGKRVEFPRITGAEKTAKVYKETISEDSDHSICDYFNTYDDETQDYPEKATNSTLEQPVRSVEPDVTKASSQSSMPSRSFQRNRPFRLPSLGHLLFRFETKRDFFSPYPTTMDGPSIVDIDLSSRADDFRGFDEQSTANSFEDQCPCSKCRPTRPKSSFQEIIIYRIHSLIVYSISKSCFYYYFLKAPGC